MKLFIPNMYQESIYKIDYKKLKKKGIKLLLFDLDNTCVGYHEKEPTIMLEKLFKKLTKLGFEVVIFSNATSKRLVPFKKLGVYCHSFSKKPLGISFRKIMKKYSLYGDSVCIIGDQLFTDISGGNKAGIVTCLVDPVTNNDFLLTNVFRYMEGFIFKSMDRKGILKRGEYYD